MHKISASMIAVLTAGFLTSSATAADLGKNGSDPTGSDYSYAHPAFQGFGIGVHGGGQFTNVEIGDGGFSFDGVGADGFVGGIHAEYLFGFAGNFRAGPYIEGGFSNVNTNFETPGGDLDLLNQEHYYGGGIKAGMVFFNSALIFARAGVERAKWEFAEEIGVDVDSFVLGGGVEAMVASNVSVGLGLDYVTPFNIEADGEDVTDLFDETESFRGTLRLTYRH
jgi:opacity protein-like surface antigen